MNAAPHTRSPAPLLTVIVISKDDPAGLRRSLDSIAEQRFDDLEVVVVATGSSAQVEISAWRTLSLRKLVQGSRGISNAFNEGIAAARGRWLNFLNGGDAYQGGAVLRSIEGTLRNASASLVTGRARDVHTGVMIPRDRSFHGRNVELVSHQATFFRKHLFDQFGGYDPGYGIRMDFEWMLRLPARSPAVWTDEVLVSFEGKGISTTRPWQSCLEERRAIRRHRPGVVRELKLLALYLPFRLLRAQWRSLWN